MTVDYIFSSSLDYFNLVSTYSRRQKLSEKLQIFSEETSFD